MIRAVLAQSAENQLRFARPCRTVARCDLALARDALDGAKVGGDRRYRGHSRRLRDEDLATRVVVPRVGGRRGRAEMRPDSRAAGGNRLGRATARARAELLA